jgi:hypothetical protein
VAVVARSVEAKEEELLAAEAGEVVDVPGVEPGADDAGESVEIAESATIDETDTTRPDSIGESEA